jgi:hypothetical protein
MPFGLTNILAIYQYLINYKLYKYLNIFIVIYLDNILVYSKIEAEYIEYIRKVLVRLREVGLLLKPEKCQFY